MQFHSLMSSVMRQVAHDRTSRVYDTFAGAQGDAKGLKKHVNHLRKSAGLKGVDDGNGRDLMRDLQLGKK